MNKALLAHLNDAERVLWFETDATELEGLDEDEVLDLHARIRRARNKYTGQYRRQASARVGDRGGRGAAQPRNTSNAARAEVFEEALARARQHRKTTGGVKRDASSQSAGARRQARRDSR